MQQILDVYDKQADKDPDLYQKMQDTVTRYEKLLTDKKTPIIIIIDPIIPDKVVSHISTVPLLKQHTSSRKYKKYFFRSFIFICILAAAYAIYLLVNYYIHKRTAIIVL